MLSGVLDCLPSHNPVFFLSSLSGELFIDEVTGDIYKYDCDSKLFISLREVDHEATEDLRKSLNESNQRWLNIAAPYWSYKVPTTLPFLYIERGTDEHFYKNNNSDDSHTNGT